MKQSFSTKLTVLSLVVAFFTAQLPWSASSLAQDPTPQKKKKKVDVDVDTSSQPSTSNYQPPATKTATPNKTDEKVDSHLADSVSSGIGDIVTVLKNPTVVAKAGSLLQNYTKKYLDELNGKERRVFIVEEQDLDIQKIINHNVPMIELRYNSEEFLCSTVNKITKKPCGIYFSAFFHDGKGLNETVTNLALEGTDEFNNGGFGVKYKYKASTSYFKKFSTISGYTYNQYVQASQKLRRKAHEMWIEKFGSKWPKIAIDLGVSSAMVLGLAFVISKFGNAAKKGALETAKKWPKLSKISRTIYQYHGLQAVKNHPLGFFFIASAEVGLMSSFAWNYFDNFLDNAVFSNEEFNRQYLLDILSNGFCKAVASDDEYGFGTCIQGQNEMLQISSGKDGLSLALLQQKDTKPEENYQNEQKDEIAKSADTDINKVEKLYAKFEDSLKELFQAGVKTNFSVHSIVRHHSVQSNQMENSKLLFKLFFTTYRPNFADTPYDKDSYEIDKAKAKNKAE